MSSVVDERLGDGFSSGGKAKGQVQKRREGQDTSSVVKGRLKYKLSSGEKAKTEAQ